LIEGRAMAQSDIKITFEDLKSVYYKKYPSTNGTIGQTNLLTKKFKELLQEFCQPRRSKKLSDQVG
jgi:trigger factor